MRNLVTAQKKPAGIWDLKLAPGGLLDIEFLAQFVILRFAALDPSLCRRHPAMVLRDAGERGMIDAAAAVTLVEAHELQTTLIQVGRLTMGELGAALPLHSAMVALLCRVANQPDLSHLESLLDDMRDGVRRVFQTLLADQADAPAAPDA